MPPILALVLTTMFVLWLLRRDGKTAGTSYAFWIPMTWVTIISSRFVSEWFYVRSTSQNFMEGSPIDQPVFLVLIILAVCVLLRRGVSARRVAAANIAVMIFLGYGFVSIMWSDFPWIAFKRWVKVVGHPLMVLVLLTEPKPKDALEALFRRLGFVLIPASVMLIKYFPSLGRGFSGWTGQAYNTGVTTNKNTLGALCCIVGLYFAWNVIVNRKQIPAERRQTEILTNLFFIGMVYWLMSIADCATATVALTLGIATMFLLGVEHLRRKQLLMYVAAAALFYIGVDSLLNVTDAVIIALGRDPTLSDRTNLWEDILAMPLNPLVGAGFESFWLGDRLLHLWTLWPFQPNQAHSGYIETYIQGGWLGVCALLILLSSYYRRAKAELMTTPATGRFKMAFLAILLLTNYTEATFKALHPFFFLTFALMLTYPIPIAQKKPLFVTLRQPQPPRTPPVVKLPGRPQPLPKVASNAAARKWRAGGVGRR